MHRAAARRLHLSIIGDVIAPWTGRRGKQLEGVSRNFLNWSLWNHHPLIKHRPIASAVASPATSSSSSSSSSSSLRSIMSASANGADGAPPPPEVPEGHELITEGKVHMVYPRVAKGDANSVFYNPVQVQNRDLSVLMLGMYAERVAERRWARAKRKEVRREMEGERREAAAKEGSEKKKETKEERKARAAEFDRELGERVEEARKSVDFTKLAIESTKSSEADGRGEGKAGGGLSVLEALAASGLRSLRYWTEVPGLRTVVINDLDPVAVDMARENVTRNGFEGDLVADKAAASTADVVEEGDNFTAAKRRPRGIMLQAGDATHEMYVSRLPPKLPASQCNPTQLRHQKPQYDVIDLDPYGSAAPFVDAAMQSVVDGGMLAVTCTDMAALGGSHPETCYGRYGAFPIQRAGYLQELAVRILLYHLSVVAGRYGRTIRPVLSVGMAFYCRVFVEVYDDKAGVNNLSLNHGHLFQSVRCSSFHVTPVATNDFQQQQTTGGEANSGSDEKKKPSNLYKNGRGPEEPSCGETGGPYKVAGPLWTGPLHDMEAVNAAIDRLEGAMANGGVSPTGGTPVHPLHTAETLHGLLVSVSEELNDVPLYHLLPSLCSSVNSSTIPKTKFRAALVNAGYRVSAYHKEPDAVKTDAPNHVVWDVVRAWCRENPPQKKKESKKHRKGEEQGSQSPIRPEHVDVATRILSNESRTEVDFTVSKGLDAGKRKARRWAQNPEANWGPKKAAASYKKGKIEVAQSSNKRKQDEATNGGKDADGAEEPNAKQSKT